MAQKKIKKSSAKKIKKAPRRLPQKARMKKERVVSKTVMLRGPRLPDVKGPVNEKPLSAGEISKFRDVLGQRREDLVAIVNRKKEEELQVAEEAEMGDEADVATRSVEKDIFFELTDAEKQTLDMVEAALRKIEKGIFGRCEACQKPVGRQRLDVMPWARYCIQCQARQEVPFEA